MKHYMFGVVAMVSLPVICIGSWAAAGSVYAVWWLAEAVGRWWKG